MTDSAATTRVAAHAVCLHRGQILLVHQASPGPAEQRWTLPGGGLEFGEAACDAVRREVAEECGLTAEVGRLLGVHQSVHDSAAGPRHDIRLLHAVRVAGELRPDPSGEIDRVGWFDVDALPARRTGWVDLGVQLALAARSVQLRPAGPADEPLLQRLVFRAWRWDRDWDEDDYLAHLGQGQTDSYVEDFGRRAGDVGVVAERQGVPIGAAWARLFTTLEHRAGFVDQTTPEVVIALLPGHEGSGIGARLLEVLLLTAQAKGHRALSLDVATGNDRARRLYERAGFELVGEHHRDGVLHSTVLRRPPTC